MNNEKLKSDIVSFFKDKEEAVAQIATDQYREKVKAELAVIDFLSTKEFKYGQVVKLVSHAPMAQMMDCTSQYGIIVGSMVHENIVEPFTRYGTNIVDHSYIERIKERDPYRVYQNRKNPFIGTDADSIQKVESWDEVPDKLKTFELRIYVTRNRYIPLDIKTFI